MEDELSGKIMKEFGLKAIAYSCLIDDGSKDKKSKSFLKVSPKKKS